MNYFINLQNIVCGFRFTHKRLQYTTKAGKLPISFVFRFPLPNHKHRK